MRPINKLNVGDRLPISGAIINPVYHPHGIAYPILVENLGHYCSYCEVFSADLEVEHIISKDQDNSKVDSWDNFLLSCGRCNGKDNKSNKKVDIDDIFLPHIHNTLLAFEYREGGFIMVRTDLSSDQQRKAENMLKLVCLDKYDGNPKYQSILPRDERWRHRRNAWEQAVIRLRKYENGEHTAIGVADFAKERGFFSVWFSVFNAHKEVKQAIINAFQGTANCFDENFNPIPRTLNDL